MAGHAPYESARLVGEIVGKSERTIRRWSARGLVRAKTIRQGLMQFRVYSVSDAKRVASERIEEE